MPTLATYVAAGVVGVNANNLDAINDALASAVVDGARANTPAELQAIVDSYNTVLGGADGTAGNPWSGANDFSNALGATCASLATLIANAGGRPTIGVGDWMLAENGNMVNKAGDGVAELRELKTKGFA